MPTKYGFTTDAEDQRHHSKVIDAGKKEAKRISRIVCDILADLNRARKLNLKISSITEYKGYHFAEWSLGNRCMGGMDDPAGITVVLGHDSEFHSTYFAVYYCGYLIDYRDCSALEQALSTHTGIPIGHTPIK